MFSILIPNVLFVTSFHVEFIFPRLQRQRLLYTNITPSHNVQLKTGNNQIKQFPNTKNNYYGTCPGSNNGLQGPQLLWSDSMWH